MPYNSYFPAGYQPMYVPQTQPQAVTQTHANSGLIWVQGIEAAKSYLVAPNTTVMLMDSEGDQFYLKSADASGMPMPLRVFKYEEIKTERFEGGQKDASMDLSNYVEKSVYEDFRRHIEDVLASITAAEKPKKGAKDE